MTDLIFTFTMTDKLDDGSDGAGNKQGMMISVNNLNYLLEPDLTVAVNSTYKKHFFNADTYSQNRSAVCILNSGADYLDFRKSYLSFDLQLTDPSGTFDFTKASAPASRAVSAQISPEFMVDKMAPEFDSTDPMIQLVDAATILQYIPSYDVSLGDQYFTIIQEPRLDSEAAQTKGKGIDVSFGRGTACNVIKRLTIQSRSGDEICRIENQDVLSHILNNYAYSRDWQETVRTSFDGTMFNCRDVRQTKRRYHIPLSCLSGFFNYERLMPSMLCSGLRVTIDWNNLEDIFVFSGPPNSAFTFGYSVSKVELDIKSIQLTDSCQRYLNEVSATSGLEIVYADYNNTIHQIPTNGGEVNMEVRQACSRALRAFCRIRDSTKKTSLLADSQASEFWTVSQFQWRLGSLYFPQQPVQAKNIASFRAPSTQKLVLKETGTPDAITNFTPTDVQLNNSSEAYVQTLEMFSTYGPNPRGCHVALDNFTLGSEHGYILSGQSGIALDFNHKKNQDTYNGSQQVVVKGGSRMYELQRAFDYFRVDKKLLQEDIVQEYLDLYLEKAKAEGIDVLALDSLEILKYLGVVINSQKFRQIAKVALNNLASTRVTGVPIDNSFTAFPADSQVIDPDAWVGCDAVIPVNLERSSLFNLSGVPINNSRVLSLQMTLTDTVLTQQKEGSGVAVLHTIPSGTEAQPKTYNHTGDIFLQYVKLARVFLNNVEIEQ